MCSEVQNYLDNANHIRAPSIGSAVTRTPCSTLGQVWTTSLFFETNRNALEIESAIDSAEPSHPKTVVDRVHGPFIKFLAAILRIKFTLIRQARVQLVGTASKAIDCMCVALARPKQMTFEGERYKLYL